MKIINDYGKASGQQLNISKSSILFGNKVPAEIKTSIKQALGISNEGGMGMYLGLPEKICGSKKQAFAYIQDRLNTRVNSWSAKLLSKGGKEVLLKSVAQALPTYIMSCFLLPQDIIKKLTSSISRFWWSSKQNNRGLHWIAWDKICLPHEEGGLGFRDLKNFNLALLAKQLWRLLQHPNSLLARVLKGRYFKNSNPVQVDKVNSPSYVWRSLMAAKPLLKAGLRRSISSGSDTKVWSEPWLPTTPPQSPHHHPSGAFDPELLVAELFVQSSRTWNLTALRNLFSPEDVNLICSIKPRAHTQKDGYCWSPTISGSYSVKSGYNLAMELKQSATEPSYSEPSTKGLKAKVWKVKTSSKIKHFIWQATANCLPVCDRLVERHCGQDRSCPRCGCDKETVNHLLFECPPSIQTWALANVPFIPGSFPSPSAYSNLDHILWKAKGQNVPDEILFRAPWILWYLWKARNEKVFNGKDTSPLDTLQLAISEAETWKLAQIAHNTQVVDEPVRPLPSQGDPAALRRNTCRVDASWHKTDLYFGGGLHLKDEAGRESFGSFASNQTVSPIQAECRSLLWAMNSVLLLGHHAMSFEIDCQQLVKLLQEDQDYEEWPALLAELDDFRSISSKFSYISISFIPRALNSRADLLAKEGRSRQYVFSHVHSSPARLISEINFLESS